MAQTTTTIIPPAIQEHYDRTLLTRALPALVHGDFGQRRPLPQNESDNIKFRKYPSWDAALTPLGEGVNPAGHTPTYTDITAKVLKYGDFIEVTEEVELFNVSGTLTEFSELNGEQAGDTVDKIHRNILATGSSVHYTNGSTRAGLTSIISKITLDKALRTLANNNAKFFTTVIKAGVGVGSLPIRPAFWAITHPDVMYDIENLDIEGYISVEKYASQGPVKPNERGAYRNLRFVATTNAKIHTDAATGAADDGTHKSTTGTYADVYTILIFSPDAYGITEIRGKGIQSIYHDKKTAGGPLEVASTMGWKTWTVLKILDDARMTRIETLASI